MAKLGFRLKVREGHEEEYISTHENVWPELINIIADVGIHNYSIFIDNSHGRSMGASTFSSTTPASPAEQHQLRV